MEQYSTVTESVFNKKLKVNRHSRVIAARCTIVKFYPKLVIVEVLTTLYAVEFSRNFALLKIILEDNSLQVINTVHNTEQN
jgi:hypothetical protein